MLPRRIRRYLAAVAALTVIALTGCDVAVLYGPYDPSRSTDPDLLSVTSPDGGSFTAGESITIVWTGSAQPDTLTIDLYLSGEYVERIASNVVNTGSWVWSIPSAFTNETEVYNEYTIVVSGYHPGQSTGELLLTAYSERFTIVPAASGGLSDVTVNNRSISITLTDNGQQIDGDTIDLSLNGTIIVSGHVLTGPTGTTFPLELRSGANVLEIYAVNEGSVTPNTALLVISDVTAGAASQEWRLTTGETGTLTITAP